MGTLRKRMDGDLVVRGMAVRTREAYLGAVVGLGALGVIATVTLRTVPAFTIRRTDSPMPLDETLERLQDLADGSDHFEFYVFPHTDVALLRQSERTDEPPKPRHAAVEFGQEVILENWVMGAIARAGRRRTHLVARSQGGTFRARIGSQASRRRRSSARSPAVAYRLS